MYLQLHLFSNISHVIINHSCIFHHYAHVHDKVKIASKGFFYQVYMVIKFAFQQHLPYISRHATNKIIKLSNI